MTKPSQVPPCCIDRLYQYMTQLSQKCHSSWVSLFLVVTAHNDDCLLILGSIKNEKTTPLTGAHLCSFTLQVTAMVYTLTDGIWDRWAPTFVCMCVWMCEVPNLNRSLCVISQECYSCLIEDKFGWISSLKESRTTSFQSASSVLNNTDTLALSSHTHTHAAILFWLNAHSYATSQMFAPILHSKFSKYFVLLLWKQ